MANITGTEGIDTLTGTADADVIQGLGGNDRIIASGGSDSIDGGAGYDKLDYSNYSDATNVNVLIDLTGTRVGKVNKNTNFFAEDRLLNIESIIVNKNQNAAISNFLPYDTVLEVDLSKNRQTYSSASIGTKTLSIENFKDIIGGTKNSRLIGNDLDNVILTVNNTDGNINKTNSTIVGSKGNDTLVTLDGDILDYSNFGRAVKILPTAFAFFPAPNVTATNYALNIDKSGFGTDSLQGLVAKIVGATNQANTIDASSAVNDIASLDVNLANNFLKVNAPNVNINGTGNFDNPQYNVINFVNVIGSKKNDKIVGSDKNGKLTGGGGNDTITGGNKNDRITGSDSTARGVGECDTLTGGGGRDKFILGDKNGAYYVGNGNNDYATITDFNLFQDSINLGGFRNYSFAAAGNNTIELYSGKDVKTRDLIAKIQIASGISSNNANSRSISGSSPNLDSIIGKIDIVSGSEFERES